MNAYQWIAIGIVCVFAIVLVIFRKKEWVKKTWKIFAIVLPPLLTLALVALRNKATTAPAVTPAPKTEPIPPAPVVTPVPAKVITIGVDYQLSPHFTFGTMVKTDHREFILENQEQAKKYFYNLAHLCNTVLEPVYTLMGPMSISSGYRCHDLNTVVGGSDNSQHSFGEAADTEYANYSVKDAFNKLAFANIPFSQIIFEFGSWVHIGMIDPVQFPGKVSQRFIASRVLVDGGPKTKTEYTSVTQPI
jgi:zinc D-Ala-D-Ala carboxypeptidase